VVLVITTGCDDQFGPTHWVARPDTVDLFSLTRAEYLKLPAGFDMLHGDNGQPVTIEEPGASGNWDFALTEVGGRLSLLPAGAIAELGDTRSGIARLPGAVFESVTEVPRDRSLYQDTVPVELEAGMVYAVRSRHYYLYAGQNCSSYGILTPISINEEDGTLRFAFMRNPNCNDISMVPPKAK
jgi:hypothetical protein